MKSENLLIELLVEELPPKALKKLGAAFESSIVQALSVRGLIRKSCEVRAYATPRRLGVWIAGVPEQGQDQLIKQKIMPVSVGLNMSGKPTPALIKKIQAMGMSASDIASFTQEMDGKSMTLFCERQVKGILLERGLQESLDAVIRELPIPKMMSYQLERDCEVPGWSTVQFVRPAHGLVILWGADVLNIGLLGLRAGRITQGHRFESLSPTITLDHADDYERKLLEEGRVVPSFLARREMIQKQLEQAAKGLGENFTTLEDPQLLDEVCALVERPNVLICGFEKEFLAVPQECLILTMKANQKYFPLFDKEKKLTEKFLVVSNITPDDASAVILGNERVVRPRLADAKFFFEQDKKKRLEERVAALDKVVYHNKLGTQGERVKRVGEIARVLTKHWRTNSTAENVRVQDPLALHTHVALAARLAKADLLTDMVTEFPELQGTMGKYYALHEGLPSEVALAIEEHYKPRFSGDALASNPIGLILAMADKLETLVGLFGINQMPTGDKDPFALRRHALGFIRMMVECDLQMELSPIIQEIIGIFGDRIQRPVTELTLDLKQFIYERLSSNLREAGFSIKCIDAVISQHPEMLSGVPRRVKAVQAFSALPEAPALAAANKRIANILKKEHMLQGAVEDEKIEPIQVDFLVSAAEQGLHATLLQTAPVVQAHYARGDYRAALIELAALKGPTDVFFEEVMVNDPREELRQNRLALLGHLYQQMNQVAELARLAS